LRLPVADDDAGRQNIALVAVEACELDGGLVGLGARVAEKGVVHAGEFAQPFRQLLL
jgi:hypothetical protein